MGVYLRIIEKENGKFFFIFLRNYYILYFCLWNFYFVFKIFLMKIFILHYKKLYYKKININI